MKIKYHNIDWQVIGKLSNHEYFLKNIFLMLSLSENHKNENHEIHKIACQNHENLENLIISCQNYENLDF